MQAQLSRGNQRSLGVGDVIMYMNYFAEEKRKLSPFD